MSCFRLFSFMLLLTFRLTAGPLDDLKLNFETRCNFAEVDRDQQVKKLDASYLAALERLVEKAKATGNLDAVIPLVDEVQSVKKAASPMPDLPATASAELKQMRTKHAEASAKILKTHAETLTSLADKMEAALKVQETELTKAGKIEEALTAKKMREDLSLDGSIAKARNLTDQKASGSDNLGWRLLLREKVEAEKKGAYFDILRLEVESDVKTTVSNHLKNLDIDPASVLFSHAPMMLQYKLTKKATRSRGRIMLANSGGNVRFKIYAGESLVLDQVLKEKVTVEPFNLEFAPTDQIRIEIDPNEALSGDWAAWIAPEIR